VNEVPDARGDGRPRDDLGATLVDVRERGRFRIPKHMGQARGMDYGIYSA
jgi:hypothetical protein